MDESQTTGTELTIPKVTDLASLFGVEGEIDRIIRKIEEDVMREATDAATEKGRKAARSLAHKVARTKTMMDEKGKALNDDKRAFINAVDADRRVIRERLDALKAKVLAPVEEWEVRERHRKEEHEHALQEYEIEVSPEWDSQKIDHLLNVLRQPDEREWEEYADEARAARLTLEDRLIDALKVAKQREADQAELTRLRAEAAERERQDAERARQEQIAREHEEQMAEEARRKAEAAHQKAERERIEAARAEQAEKQRQADISAATERAAAAAREAAELREARHKAELDRQAEEFAKGMLEAKAREERAAQAERDRIAAERKEAEDARAKREADMEHRKQITRDIVQALEPLVTRQNPAGAIAGAIMSGEIPHITVNL